MTHRLAPGKDVPSDLIFFSNCPFLSCDLPSLLERQKKRFAVDLMLTEQFFSLGNQLEKIPCHCLLMIC